MFMGDLNAKINANDWKDGAHPNNLNGGETDKMPQNSDRNGKKFLLRCEERQLKPL